MQIRQACTDNEIAIARILFQEYAAWLGVDLAFQGFGAELVGLPGVYSPPRGRLLLASEKGATAGCIALRSLTELACEMKRLFVRPAFHGRGIGKMLAERAVREAKMIGYASMKLDTLPSMDAARRLYEALGFVRIPAYYDTPLPGTIFMELQL